jgi:hypothetical protein
MGFCCTVTGDCVSEVPTRIVPTATSSLAS